MSCSKALAWNYWLTTNCFAVRCLHRLGSCSLSQVRRAVSNISSCVQMLLHTRSSATSTHALHVALGPMISKHVIAWSLSAALHAVMFWSASQKDQLANLPQPSQCPGSPFSTSSPRQQTPEQSSGWPEIACGSCLLAFIACSPPGRLARLADHAQAVLEHMPCSLLKHARIHRRLLRG